MKKSLIFFLGFLLMAMGVHGVPFFLENSTTELVISPAINSSYHFENSILNTTIFGNFSIITETDIFPWHDNLSDYTETGTGDAFQTFDIRCFDNDLCISLTGDTGAGGDETVSIEINTPVNTTDSSSPVFSFSLVDLDLEMGETMSLFFWNGIGYDNVFTYNGTNNGVGNGSWTQNDFITYNLSLDAYKMDNFQWFFQGIMNEGPSGGALDRIILDRIIINQTGLIPQTYPLFYNKINFDVSISTASSELYLFTNTQKNITSNVAIYNESGQLEFMFSDVIEIVPGNNNITKNYFTNTSFPLLQNDYIELEIMYNGTDTDETNLHWSNESFSSKFDAVFQLSNITFPGFFYDNTSFPHELEVNITSLNPITSVILLREGIPLGNMHLCGPGRYCFTDTTVTDEDGNVSYTVVATDTLSITRELDFTVLIDPIRGVILYPLFEGDFYVPLNESTLFSLFLHDTQGNIVTDGDVKLNFTLLGDVFNLTYNPSTTQYQTNLLFDVPGMYPYEINLGPQFYMVEENQITSGTVFVNEPNQVCFRVFTDMNLTESYSNNLASIFIFDEEKEGMFATSIRRLDQWTDGKIQGFNVSMFHTEYIDGQGCVDVFNQTPTYSIWLVDGVFKFKDNFDPPFIEEYFGTTIHLTSMQLEPDTTYDIYMPRYHVTWSRLADNLMVFTIILAIVVVSFVMFIVGGPLAGILSFVFFIALWIFIELALKVFA